MGFNNDSKPAISVESAGRIVIGTVKVEIVPAFAGVGLNDMTSKPAVAVAVISLTRRNKFENRNKGIKLGLSLGLLGINTDNAYGNSGKIDFHQSFL